MGHFLNVHEGPIEINRHQEVATKWTHLKAGNCVTIEPGYYEKGNFGVRYENVLEVVDTEGMPGFCEFRPLTMCPIDRKMIQLEMLTSGERDYIDQYHSQVKSALSPILSAEGKTEVLTWLEENTAPLPLA